MNWDGEEYSRRLESYSDNTIRIISEFNTRETFFKSVDIVMETDTEEEVARKLLQLKEDMQGELMALRD